MDRSALSKLETGQRPNPTLETLVRYGEAVGKRLVVSLADGWHADRIATRRRCS
jgi:transcriptional regulator with XRE-family HTH domain